MPLDDEEDDENPRWTAERVARAKPAAEVLPVEVLDAFKPRKRGPQVAATKQAVTLRLDRDVLDAFKAEGAGWQTRINETLRASLRRA